MNKHPSLKPYPYLLKTTKPLSKKWGYLTSVKMLLYIYAMCFIFGGTRHWMDILDGGLLPYKDIPIFFNLYLTSLAIFDFVVVILLFLRPIYGLVFALMIMASDLLVDFYLSDRYWHSSLFENTGLQLLLIFGMFLFLTVPFAMKFIVGELAKNQ